MRKKNIRVAREILKLARELMAMEFNTEEEKKKYQREHDVRPGTKLVVKQSENPTGNKEMKKPVRKVNGLPEEKVRGDANKAFAMLDLDYLTGATCAEVAGALQSEMAKIDKDYNLAWQADGHTFLMIDDWIVDAWEPSGSRPKLKMWHYTDPIIQNDHDYQWDGKNEGAPPPRIHQ